MTGEHFVRIALFPLRHPSDFFVSVVLVPISLCLRYDIRMSYRISLISFLLALLNQFRISFLKRFAVRHISKIRTDGLVDPL